MKYMNSIIIFTIVSIISFIDLTLNACAMEARKILFHQCLKVFYRNWRQICINPLFSLSAIRRSENRFFKKIVYPLIYPPLVDGPIIYFVYIQINNPKRLKLLLPYQGFNSLASNQHKISSSHL